MRAAVAQAEQAGRIVEHLADRLVVAGDVVHHREVEILAVLEHVVVGDLLGRAAFARGDRGDALLRAGLVVRRIAHDEELVEALGDDLAELRELGDLGVRRRRRPGFAAASRDRAAAARCSSIGRLSSAL